MDSSNNQNTAREKDQLRMDILAEKVEIYRIMAHIFFRYLSKDDKIDALTEAAEKIREEVLNKGDDDV